MKKKFILHFVEIHLELLGVTDLELELVSSFKMFF